MEQSIREIIDGIIDTIRNLIRPPRPRPAPVPVRVRRTPWRSVRVILLALLLVILAAAETRAAPLRSRLHKRHGLNEAPPGQP